MTLRVRQVLFKVLLGADQVAQSKAAAHQEDAEEEIHYEDGREEAGEQEHEKKTCKREGHIEALNNVLLANSGQWNGQERGELQHITTIKRYSAETMFNYSHTNT